LSSVNLRNSSRTVRNETWHALPKRDFKDKLSPCSVQHNDPSTRIFQWPSHIAHKKSPTSARHLLRSSFLFDSLHVELVKAASTLWRQVIRGGQIAFFLRTGRAAREASTQFPRQLPSVFSYSERYFRVWRLHRSQRTRKVEMYIQRYLRISAGRRRSRDFRQQLVQPSWGREGDGFLLPRRQLKRVLQARPTLAGIVESGVIPC